MLKISKKKQQQFEEKYSCYNNNIWATSRALNNVNDYNNENERKEDDNNMECWKMDAKATENWKKTSGA